jgi:hypothetical protein
MLIYWLNTTAKYINNRTAQKSTDTRGRMSIELYRYNTYIYWLHETFEHVFPPHGHNVQVFPERVHTASQKRDQIIIYTAFVFLNVEYQVTFVTAYRF